MPQAIADPLEIRRFAYHLKQFVRDIDGQMASIHGQLHTLSSTWRDQEHQKFTEEFDQTLLVIRRFVEATNLHIPFLLRKADRLEEYLQQH